MGYTECTPIGIDTKLELLLSSSYDKKCNYKCSQQNCRKTKTKIEHDSDRIHAASYNSKISLFIFC